MQNTRTPPNQLAVLVRYVTSFFYTRAHAAGIASAAMHANILLGTIRSGWCGKRLWVLLLAFSGMVPKIGNTAPIDDAAFATEQRHVIFTERDGGSVDPTFIARRPDGAFIASGDVTATCNTWLAQLEQTGTAHWVRNFAPQPADACFTQRAVLARTYLLGMVMTSDGGTILCGNFPDPHRSGTFPGLLILDRNGRTVRQIDLTRDSPAPPRSLPHLHSCVGAPGGLIVVGGRTTDTHNPVPNEPSWEITYWVSRLDLSGRRLWEHDYPTSIRHFWTSQTESTLTADDRLIVTGTDGKSTEALSIALNGALIAQRALEGQFLLVRPVERDNAIELYGTRPGSARFFALDLDGGLHDAGERSAPGSPIFGPGLAWRLPNRSLALFGVINERGAESQAVAAALFLDPALKHPLRLRFQLPETWDPTIIHAAAPGAKTGDFVVMRIFTPIKEGAPHGVAFHFIHYGLGDNHERN